MKLLRLKYLIIVLVFPFGNQLFAQGDIEDMLVGEVENINMVYKPVIGVGMGSFFFLGDVRDNRFTEFNGDFGYKVNVSTFLDNSHYIRANFYSMFGSLTGNERSVKTIVSDDGTTSTYDLSRNLNFKSDILVFGLNLNYDFDHFINPTRMFRPYVSLGAELFTFDSKIDSFGVENTKYYYHPDGSVRDGANFETSNLMTRDYNYETELRHYDWGMGDYPQYSFAIPIEAGFDFWMSDRVMFRVGTSYHYVLSDLIDHVSHENDPELGVVGDKKGDHFMYSYFSLHLDLFSSDKEIEWNKLFADVELDMTFLADEDGDDVWDGWDECPGTPWGVEIDTSGCPLDDDLDGVPNYLDDEVNSRYGAMVDDRGVEMSTDDLIALIDQSHAVAREDVSRFLRTPESYAHYQKRSAVEIPEKFVGVDTDGDQYISYDEMMDAIDAFFNFSSDLTTDDIYELNEFFFMQ